jgi:hypothetical protein
MVVTNHSNIFYTSVMIPICRINPVICFLEVAALVENLQTDIQTDMSHRLFCTVTDFSI